MRIASSELVGRDAELARLMAEVERTTVAGDALLLRGDPGIGKSALLEATVDAARARGFTVLTATGFPSESRLPHAALHQLLRPLRGAIAELAPVQSEALGVVLGTSPETAPQPFMIAAATLELVASRAAIAPVLIAVDDAQWLDEPTAAVLSFIARRVSDDPILMIAVTRGGQLGPMLDAGLRSMTLGALDDDDARRLLALHGRELTDHARDQLLMQAGGNPLALIELPTADGISPDPTVALGPALAPLSERLRQAFQPQVAGMPATCRRLLLIAACDDHGRIDEMMAAAHHLGVESAELSDLAAALDSGLVTLHEGRVSFRHPLVAAAVYESASPTERAAAHTALATVLVDRPDRRAWHRATAATNADESIASELDGAARRAAGHGATGAALAALQRAAQLSQDAAQRRRRSLDAAELAFELGRPELVDLLLTEASGDPRDDASSARARLIRERFECEPAPDAEGFRALLHEAASVSGQEAYTRLEQAARKVLWSDLGAEARELLTAAVERMGVPEGDPRRLVLLALIAPLSHGAAMSAALDGLGPLGWDADEARLLGTAALAVGHDDQANRLLSYALEGLTAHRRHATACQVLASRAVVGLRAGRWVEAHRDATKARQLAGGSRQQLWASYSVATLAQVAALRGDAAEADDLILIAQRDALPARATSILSSLQLARAHNALGDNRPEEAVSHLQRIFDPTDIAGHHLRRVDALVDLVEAATSIDRREVAERAVHGLQSSVTDGGSTKVRHALMAARVILADDAQLDERYEAALACSPRLPGFERARLQLIYGTRLRRMRQVTRCREPLRAAHDGFSSLGAAPRAERALQELRASGQSHCASGQGRDELTPQEREIAELAAAGLSNREIGQRLYLSHRTVGSHLYRLFPKLGISSRRQLTEALVAGSL